mmetsp:Transcript_1201/g.2120  ORF Transcript_1201/g.2120 Transcript_1201/m.2120 type:complete len:282 (+) Transcript_1201:225-1070(+)
MGNYGDICDVPGLYGSPLFYKTHDRTMAMPDESRARREETIDRYEHRADTKYLQLYQPDWNESTEVKDGDHRWTKRNAIDLLSNTLGASKAEDHKAVARATTRFGLHPWDTKTNMFTIEKPETSSGWDLTCTHSPHLTSAKHETLREKSQANYEKKCNTLLKDYRNPTLVFKDRHVLERDARRAAKLIKESVKNPQVGPIKVRAKPKTKREDVELVHELSYAPPKVHVARRSSEALEHPAEAFIHPPEEPTWDDTLDAQETDLGETLRDLQVDDARQLEAQ